MRRRALLTALGSALITAPLAARAQPKAMPVIGYLFGGSPGPTSDLVVNGFRQGLAETGFVDGQNVTISYLWAEDQADRYPALAAEFVRREVDVIVTANGFLALAAKRATSAIPIVFVSGDEPVELGLVRSLARPGGNLTGISLLIRELMRKRFELVCELVPGAKVIGVLVNPARSIAAGIIADMGATARIKGVTLRVVEAASEREIARAFEAITRPAIDALIAGADPLFFINREQVVALAARYRVPAIYDWREYADAGGLISYGVSYTGAYRRQGVYAGKILRGEKPVDLPVEQPTKFELVINLKTAKALGLTVPHSLLSRADEVIE